MAFERILGEGQERFGMRICGYCIMGNHWHLLLWPESDNVLPEFMHWVTLTHSQRYHTSHCTSGMGHIYQGRYKSFPFQAGRHYLRVLRYIEANPVRAKLVTNAGLWRWSSYNFHCGIAQSDKPLVICPSPEKLTQNWQEFVHKPISEAEDQELSNAINRGCPIGDPTWQHRTAEILELQSTMRKPGRPTKVK